MSNLTTVITGSGRRQDLLMAALRSALAAKIPQVVITSPPKLPAIPISSRIKVVTVDPDPGCNATWIYGIKAAATEWIHILHDDDLILPDFLGHIGDALTTGTAQFLLLDAASHKHGGTKKPHHKLWHNRGGLHPCANLLTHLMQAKLSISPVSGIFKREFLIRVLEEFQEHCTPKPEFEYRPKMQVGNDLLIWLRATQLKGQFLYIDKPMVSYGNHDGSVTVFDQKQTHGRLPLIYEATKTYWKASRIFKEILASQAEAMVDQSMKEQAETISKTPTVDVPLDGFNPVRDMDIATFCYLPEIQKNTAFLAHLSKFKRRFPLHILTDGDSRINSKAWTTHTVPKIGPFPVTDYAAGQYSFWAFTNTVRIARELNLDWFIYIEYDCRFAADWWDETIWNDLRRWRYEPICGGSPVCWHPWSKGHKASQAIIEYAKNYQAASGVAMAFEGAHQGPSGMALYPNGALAIYKTKAMAQCFDNSLVALNANPKICKEEQPAYDLHIGRWIINQFGPEEATKKVAYIPSVYSGSRNHHVTLEERIKMLMMGKKVAVHHLKPEELPYT